MQKILIAEDDYGMAKMYQTKFSNNDFEVFVSYTERDTLVVIQKEEIDVLLVSSDMGGLEITKKIRQNDKNIKIIITDVSSPIGFEEDKKIAIEAGANDFIDKSKTMPSGVLDVVTGKITTKKIIKELKFPIKVLFVVDNTYDILKESGKFLLEDIVSVATDNESGAMDYLPAGHDFNYVFVKASVGEKNGLDILKKLVDKQKISSHLAIMIIDEDDEDSRKKAEEIGVVNFISKSELAPKQVLEKIKEIFNENNTTK